MSKASDKFENDLVEILGRHGFWASTFPPDKDGSQPCDVIAINHKGRHLIDAKVCSKNRFEFRRMEDNQISSILHFKRKCGGEGWFALKYGDPFDGREDNIYIVDLWTLQMAEASGMKSMAEPAGIYTLERWLDEHSDRQQDMDI